MGVLNLIKEISQPQDAWLGEQHNKLSERLALQAQGGPNWGCPETFRTISVLLYWGV